VHYERGRIEFDGEIHFATNKSEIREDEVTKKSLAAITKFVTASEHAKIKFRIEGHTDSRGSAPYNQSLSERRAKALRGKMLHESILIEGDHVQLGTVHGAAGRPHLGRIPLTVVVLGKHAPPGRRHERAWL
jgi:flagellar motor protein MotB